MQGLRLLTPELQGRPQQVAPRLDRQLQVPPEQSRPSQLCMALNRMCQSPNQARSSRAGCYKQGRTICTLPAGPQSMGWSLR